MMSDYHYQARLEKIKEQLNQRASAPDSLQITRDGDLLVIFKPVQCLYNRWQSLKNPLQFTDHQQKLSRHVKAVSIVQKSRRGINKLLLPQSFIACRAKDGSHFIVKVTDFREQVRAMADIPLREIISNRLYVKFMVGISIFGLIQLIVYGRKFDLLEGAKFADTPSFLKQFKSTFKSINIFTGINPKTGKEDVFLDADWYTYIHESRWPFLKALRNGILWSRNVLFYGSIYLLHILGIFPVNKNTIRRENKNITAEPTPLVNKIVVKSLREI